MMQLFRLMFCLLIFSLPGKKAVWAQNDPEILLGRQYLENGEFEKAVDLFGNLYQRQPELGVYTGYLEALTGIKDFKTAEKIVKKQQKRMTGFMPLWVDLGAVYLKMGEQGKAAKQFDYAISHVKPYQENIIALARAFLAYKETGRAVETYEQGKKLMSGIYPFNMELAEVYQMKGDHERMISEYLDAIAWNEATRSQIEFILQSFLGDELKSARSEALRVQLLKKIQQYPDKLAFAEMLIWFFIQQKDFESAFNQSKAFDKRVKHSGNKVINLAQICISAEAYDVAVKCYEHEVSKGPEHPFYVYARTQLLDLLQKKISDSGLRKTEDILSLKKEYEKALQEMGANAGTLNLLRGFAHLKAFFLNDVAGARELLDKALEFGNADPVQRAECKLELGDILVFEGEMWESSLLFSQVDKAFKQDPIGQEAKFRNARLSFYKGEFEWAQAQLDVLKAATSKLIANDALNLSLVIQDNTVDSNYIPLQIYARADLLSYQNQDSVAVITLDSLRMLYPGHSLEDDVLYKKYQIFLKLQQTDQAARCLESIVQMHETDIYGDDATFKLAELRESMQGKAEEARNLYQKVLLDYPGSIYSNEARKRYRRLRGDNIN